MKYVQMVFPSSVSATLDSFSPEKPWEESLHYHA